MEWLFPFAALAMVCGIVAALLPEGSLRKTALLVMGVMMTLCWLESIYALLDWPTLPQQPDSVLTASTVSFDHQGALDVYARQLTRQVESLTGPPAQVSLTGSGMVASVILPKNTGQQQIESVCQALGISAEKIILAGR